VPQAGGTRWCREAWPTQAVEGERAWQLCRQYVDRKCGVFFAPVIAGDRRINSASFGRSTGGHLCGVAHRAAVPFSVEVGMISSGSTTGMRASW
jgi:hypothetical protein